MEKEIIAILEEISGNKNIVNVKADLFQAGILDSFEIVQLVMTLNEKYNIEIDAEDISPENFVSIHSIANLVKNYVEKKGH